MPRAPIFTPGYLASSSNGSAGQSALRRSSHRPYSSGPVACSKQGSLTRPYHLKRSRRIGENHFRPCALQACPTIRCTRTIRTACCRGRGAVSDLRIRRQDLQQIECPERIVGHVVPEAIVAERPGDPVVAAADLVDVELDARIGRAPVAVVHVGEVVLVGRREAFRGAAGAHRLVLDRSRLRLAAAAHRKDAETCGETREHLAKSRRLFPWLRRIRSFGAPRRCKTLQDVFQLAARARTSSASRMLLMMSRPSER